MILEFFGGKMTEKCYLNSWKFSHTWLLWSIFDWVLILIHTGSVNNNKVLKQQNMKCQDINKPELILCCF